MNKILIVAQEISVLSILSEIYNQTSEINCLNKEALLASSNMQALDCNLNFKVKCDSLYAQYEKTHMLVSVDS